MRKEEGALLEEKRFVKSSQGNNSATLPSARGKKERRLCPIGSELGALTARQHGEGRRKEKGKGRNPPSLGGKKAPKGGSINASEPETNRRRAGTGLNQSSPQRAGSRWGIKEGRGWSKSRAGVPGWKNQKKKKEGKGKYSITGELTKPRPHSRSLKKIAIRYETTTTQKGERRGKSSYTKKDDVGPVRKDPFPRTGRNLSARLGAKRAVEQLLTEEGGPESFYLKGPKNSAPGGGRRGEAAGESTRTRKQKQSPLSS